MGRFTKGEIKSAYDQGKADGLEQTRREENKPWLTGWIWDETKGFFLAMFESVWGGFTEMVVPALWKAEETLSAIATPFVQQYSNLTWKFLETLGAMDRDDIESFKVVDRIHWLPRIVNITLINAIMFGGFITQKSMIILGTMRQTLNVIHSPNPPQPREIMPTAFIAPEKTGEVRLAMKKAGLSDEHIDLLFIAMYKLYDEDQVRVLWLRGVLSEDQMFMRMRELGYTDTRIKELIQGWTIIPGPSDLFHLVAREAFEPDAIALMGLGDEFPEDQVQWLQKQGISRDWALKYWYAHWDQPSIQMGYEMLHRGVIGWEELNMLFKTIEIPPYWRDKLTKVAFQPYTRVDTRRMHKLGVLSDQELLTAYMDQGYDEEKALKMAQFTVRYNLESQKELSMAQVLTGYKERLLDKEDAIDLLMQLDYQRPQAEYLVLFEEYKLEKKYRDDIIDNIEDRYENNLIDDFEAQKRLNTLNLPAKQVEILMDSWQIKRFIDVKLPSKTDLDKFLRNKIINGDQYRLEMHKLGYGALYISWYQELIGLKKAG